MKVSGWIIDVCTTCGRQATWPFCEHRKTWHDGSPIGPPWCVPVRVAPTTKEGRRLAALNSERVRA